MPDLERKYGTRITTEGSIRITRCILAGEKLRVTQAAAGDGGGSYYVPTADQTELVGERWRGPIAHVGLNDTVPNMLDVKISIDHSASSFVCREIGLYDDDGVLIAVCNTPDTETAAASTGVDGRLTAIIHIVVTDTSALEFTVVPSLDTVSREDLDGAMAEKQDKITASGVLKGDGVGGVTTAVAGTDYGYPLLMGSGAPQTSTSGAVGQHYLDTDSGEEYTCTAKSGSHYTWSRVGVVGAAGLYGFRVNSAGHLILTYTGEDAPDFSIGEDGHLYLNL